MICCWITPTAIQLFKVPLSYFKTNGGIETVPNLAIIGMPYLPKGMPNLKEWCIVFLLTVGCSLYGWWFQPLWKMVEFDKWDYCSQYMESHKFPWFQSTKQLFISWAVGLPLYYLHFEACLPQNYGNHGILASWMLVRYLGWWLPSDGSNVVEIPELMKVAGKIIYQW